MSAANRGEEAGTSGGIVQMRVTGTVRTAEVGYRVAVDRGRDGAFDVGSGGGEDGVDAAVRVAEEVVDVPVAGVPVTGGEFLVAVDAGEAARSQCASGVGVPPGLEVAGSERADFERCRLQQLDDERVRPADCCVRCHC